MDWWLFKVQRQIGIFILIKLKTLLTKKSGLVYWFLFFIFENLLDVSCPETSIILLVIRKYWPLLDNKPKSNTKKEGKEYPKLNISTTENLSSFNVKCILCNVTVYCLSNWSPRTCSGWVQISEISVIVL